MIVTGQPKDDDLIELQNYIISTLAKDYNILVSKDDPILVAVIINKLCLDYAAKQTIQTLERNVDNLETVHAQSISTAKALAENLITHSGRYIETEIKEIFKSQVESLQKEIAQLDLQVKNSISPILQNGKATHEKNIKMLIYVCTFLAFLSLLNIGLFLIK